MERPPSSPTPVTERVIVVTLSVWGVSVALAGYFNWLAKIPLPAIALLVMVGITLPLILYYRHQSFRDWIAGIHPNNWVVLHLWRILAGFVFLHYGQQNLLPERFVVNAGYGDLVVGLMVPLVLVLGNDAKKYVAFHAFGLLDFAVAVGTGLIFSLLQVPLMETITTFPIVLIPLFGVPISGVSSIVAIDALLGARKTQASVRHSVSSVQ